MIMVNNPVTGYYNPTKPSVKIGRNAFANSESSLGGVNFRATYRYQTKQLDLAMCLESNNVDLLWSVHATAPHTKMWKTNPHPAALS